MSAISLEGLRKEYGDVTAVREVTTTVEDGELLCLLGPSGCGKSTTLRMIGGLETPTAGSVRMDGTDITDDPPYQRETSIVFQSWALFPYKSVLENVAFGPKMQGIDHDARTRRAKEMLSIVQMEDHVDQRPTDLSGGQKQRVALARSLAADPEVLLLDEPLSNLDKRLREQMQLELKNIHNEFEKTFIYVTHDQDEAFTLADRIGIMNDGELVQVGSPREVYNNPKNAFIEEFLGDTNFVSASVDTVTADAVEATLPFEHELSLPTGPGVTLSPGDTIDLSIRPETLEIRRVDQDVAVARSDGGTNRVVGTVTNLLYRGSTVRYYVELGSEEVFVEQGVAADDDIEIDDTVELTWEADEILAFHDGERIGGTQ